MRNLIDFADRLCERFNLPTWKSTRSPCGTPLPYAVAKELGFIDSRIRDLVDHLNVPGVVETIASCEGHHDRIGHAVPYVAFRSSVGFASMLEEILRDDAMSECRTFAFRWHIEPYFDGEFDLAYCFRPGTSLYDRPLSRARLDEDFKRLVLVVKRARDQFQGAGRMQSITRRSLRKRRPHG